MSDKYLVLKATCNADWNEHCYVAIHMRHKDALLTHLRLLQRISDQFVEHSYIKGVEYYMNQAISLHNLQNSDDKIDSLEFADRFDEEAQDILDNRYIYTEDIDWGDIRELDCGLCIRSVWGEWVQFRAYLSDESSEEAWLDIKIDDLEKLLNGGEA